MHRGEQGKEKPPAQREVEADIYNIMLNSHFGIETNDVRKSHLAASYRRYQAAVSNQDGKPFDKLETVFNNAGKAFGETIDRIDEYVKIYTQELQEQPEEIFEEEIMPEL